MAEITPMRAYDTDLSTVELELDALETELSRVDRELTHAEQWDDSGKNHAIEHARRALETALQRSYRARRISRGLRVYKPT